MAFPFELNKQGKKRYFHDIRKDLPKFESIKGAAVESELRQEMLLLDDMDEMAWDLSVDLANCTEENRCESPACPKCVRNNRRGFYHAVTMLSELFMEENLRITTLVYYSRGIPTEDLMNFKPSQLKDMLRKQLDRCGFKNPVVGGLELDYHEDIDLWIPHFHLLVVDDMEPLKTLRERYLKKEKRPPSKSTYITPISRPMLVQKLKHPPKQLSYLCKQRWQRIVPYINPKTGKRGTRKLRLKWNEFIKSLIVLDGYTFSDLMFSYGVRVINNEFKVTKSVSEK
jgi:hypothetical protein